MGDTHQSGLAYRDGLMGGVIVLQRLRLRRRSMALVQLRAQRYTSKAGLGRVTTNGSGQGKKKRVTHHLSGATCPGGGRRLIFGGATI